MGNFMKGNFMKIKKKVLEFFILIGKFIWGCGKILCWKVILLLLKMEG
jgi:hypothetical protein